MHQFYLGNGASSAREGDGGGGGGNGNAASNLSLTEWGASENGRSGGQAGGQAYICDMGEMWMETDRDHIKRHNWAGGNGDGED